MPCCTVHRAVQCAVPYSELCRTGRRAIPRTECHMIGLALLQGDEMSHCDILPCESVQKRKLRGGRPTCPSETIYHSERSETLDVCGMWTFSRVKMSQDVLVVWTFRHDTLFTASGIGA